MFDGRFRSTFEVGLKPVGAKLHRAGVKADQLTALGVALAIGAGVSIAAGALRGGLLLLVLAGLNDTAHLRALKP